MAEPLIAPLPMMELGPGYKIQLNAVDPTTGNTVAGVTVEAIAITGEARGSGLLDLAAGTPLLLSGPGA